MPPGPPDKNIPDQCEIVCHLHTSIAVLSLPANPTLEVETPDISSVSSRLDHVDPFDSLLGLTLSPYVVRHPSSGGVRQHFQIATSPTFPIRFF